MKNFEERTPGLRTNTQYRVMLAGYAWALSMIPDASGKSLLDCACGAGYGADRLASGALKVTGVDISPEAVGACRADYKRENLVFECMDASKLAFPDSAFDGVVSQDTIEHVTDDRAFLAEMRRVLKPGGIFILFTPHSRVHNLKPENPYHLREYSTESLDKLLKAYFTDIRYYGRRLSAGLQALETELDAARKLDRLGLRRLLPVGFRHFIASLLARLKRLKRPADINESDAEFFEGVGDSPTIIAVSRKPL